MPEPWNPRWGDVRFKSDTRARRNARAFWPKMAKSWSRRYAERIWGEFFILARRSVGKLPANFSANFDGEFR